MQFMKTEKKTMQPGFRLESCVRGSAMKFSSILPYYSKSPDYSNMPPCGPSCRPRKGQAQLARIASPRELVLAMNMSTGKKAGSRIGAGNKPIPGNVLLSEILALRICAKSETFAVKKVCGFLHGVFHKKMFKEF
jgi:hypothetical protein